MQCWSEVDPSDVPEPERRRKPKAIMAVCGIGLITVGGAMLMTPLGFRSRATAGATRSSRLTWERNRETMEEQIRQIEAELDEQHAE